MLEELREISCQLDEVALPDLVRPSEEPPHKDLVIWATNLYAYSVVGLLSELLENFLFLVESGRIAGSHPIARFIMELAGQSCFVNREIIYKLRKGDTQAAWNHLAKINLGSSDIRNIRARENMPSEELPPAPYAVGKFMDCLFKAKLPLGESVLEPLETFYDNLSERSTRRTLRYLPLSSWLIKMAQGRRDLASPAINQWMPYCLRYQLQSP